MKQIKAFVTEDGKIHATKEDAHKHEMAMSKYALIDQYMASDSNPYTTIAARSMARQSIINWEIWKATNAK